MKTGIYKDLGIKEYHENKSHISASRLKKAIKATNFLNVTTDDDKKNLTFDFGNAFETKLIEPENFKRDCFILDLTKRPFPDKNFQTKANREWKAKEIESAGDKYVISKEASIESMAQLDEMVKSCNADQFISNLIKGSEKQISIFWKDEESGLKLKTRPDLVKETPNGCVIIDIKSCKDASPEGFGKDAANLNYPIQAMMQIQGVEELIAPVAHYFYLAVEKTEPYNAQLYRFTEDDQDHFRGVVSELYEKVAKAKETGVYGGYSERATNKQGILDLRIPNWAKH